MGLIILFCLLAAIAFIATLVGDVGYSKIKGIIGEKFVESRLHSLDPRYFKVLNNLLLPSNGSTKTTQIDEVLVSNYGIFCIETKNFNGWIFGDAYQRYWTQVIFKSKKRFFNPLWQNYAHVKALEMCIKNRFPKVRIYSLVVFPSADKIQVSRVSSDSFVGSVQGMIAEIKARGVRIISDQERDEIVGIIAAHNISEKRALRAHNGEIRSMKAGHRFV